MPLPIFIFIVSLVIFVCLIIASTILRHLKIFSFVIDEAPKMPPMMGWSLFLAAAALNIFAYDVGFGIGYGMFGVCTFAAILLSFPKHKRTGAVWFLAGTGIISCLFFGFRANEFVQIVNVCAAVLCAGGLILLRSIETIRWHGLWLLKMKAGFLAHVLHHPFSFATMLRPSRGTSGGMLPTVLKTLGLTCIVLFFFSWILSEADPVFSNLIGVVRDQTIARAVLSGAIVLILLFGLSVNVSKKWQENLPQMKIFSFLEMFIPAVSLALLLGLFLGVQARYLFATHVDFQALNITYADYVRQGFIELLVASFFGSIITYILILKQHAIAEASGILKLKWVNSVLLVELMLLLASAAKRNWMYIDMYGLTRVRVVGDVFLVWLLGIILLLLALNIRRAMQERRLIAGGVILSALTVMALNALNIDAIIAKSAPPRGQSRDIVYISQLSSDAIDGWIAAIDEADARYENARTKSVYSDREKSDLADAKIAMAFLKQKLNDITAVRPWQEFNFSRLNAYFQWEEYESRNQQLSNHADCILIGIRTLQSITHTDLNEWENARVFGNSSPFMFGRGSYQTESFDSARGMLIPSPPLGGAIPPSCGQ